jgi:DNA modification methylase
MIRSKKRPRKPHELENKPGVYDPRNTLNDLSGKEWLLLSKSYWESQPSKEDRDAYAHPAPFLVKDTEKLIQLFTKKEMVVLDPFVGSGTTMLAAKKNGRKCIGIDINVKYKSLSENRLKKNGYDNDQYIVGDAMDVINADFPQVDYIVTSPPYHNILRNSGMGLRQKKSSVYRIGARDGVKYYTESDKDLGNMKTYDLFIGKLTRIMKKAFDRLNPGKYCSLVMSDFTVQKKEVFVQGDVVCFMQNIGFEFCGVTVLLQRVKPLFPFGYPYAYKINHHHQNILNFRKQKL